MDRDSRGGHNRKNIDENFFKKWAPGMAYVLGFIYADGTVEDCRKSSRTCYLGLANNDYELLVNIRALMSSNHRIFTKEERLLKIKEKYYWCKKSHNLRIGNIGIYNDLLKIGLCPRKSLVLELPKIPDQYFNYFLRGYFDGDGCINIEKKMKNRMNIIFTCGNKTFLEQIQIRLSKIIPNLKSSISFGNCAFRLRYSWKNALLVARIIYEDVHSAPYLKYKYLKYLKYVGDRGNLLFR